MTDFAELPNFWTPVVPSVELGESPYAMQVAGQRIVLFRAEGAVHALMDVCPHRGVALSGGKVVRGCLQCPFHGWEFGGDGACRHVPMNPELDRGRLSATALPVREIVGLIWVYTGSNPTTEPHIPEAFSRPGVQYAFLHEEWACHWTRAMENMLDTPHLPFVHAGTIGRQMKARLTDSSVLTQQITDTEQGFSFSFQLDGHPPGRLRWARPNNMELFISDTSTRFVRLHVWCIPTAPDRTLLLVGGCYDFGVFTSLLVAFNGVNRKVIFEDRAVVESSFPTRVPRPTEEKSVPTDKVTLRFRSWYFRHIVDGGGDEVAAE